MSPASKLMDMEDRTSSGNEGKSQTRSPSKEILPQINQTRNLKFHKLFKELPEDEPCLKGYSCAYLGDILIQGYLYISPHWFCFHSKILGIEKQIKIPVEKTLNITRERTAIFIPNAIGVVTPEDKYVFGSLLSRDNTYRVMTTVWKTLTEPEQANDGESNNNIAKANAENGSSLGESSGGESESSLCIYCGSPLNEHSRGEGCEPGSDDVTDPGLGDDIDADKNSARAVTPAGISRVVKGTTPGRRKATNQKTASTASSRSVAKATAKPTSSSAVTSSSYAAPTSSSSNTNVSQESQASVIGRLLNSVQQISKTHLLLFLCLVMVIFLASCAVIMLHKILLLQYRLDAEGASVLPLDSNQGMYSNMYFLNQEYHTSSIKRFHTVLEANIQVLDKIFSSLKGLQSSVQPCQGEQACTSTGTPVVDSMAGVKDKT